MDRRVRLVRQRDVCQYEAGRRELPGRPLPPILGPLAARLTVLGCAPTPEPLLALTYDDGPDPVMTPAILDALAAHGAQATFFVLLTQARAHPQIVRDIVARGHDLGLHGDDHVRMSTLSTAEATRRVRDARRELEGIAGAPVRLYRPAYGALTAAQVVALRLAGLEIVLWSCWARDWERSTPGEVADRAVEAAHPGGIMLLHDASEGPARVTLPADFDRGAITAAALPRLHADGYRLVTVSRLLDLAPEGRMRWGESRAEAREAVVATERAAAAG